MESMGSARKFRSAWLYNHPFFERLQTRTRRRLLSVAYIATLLALPAAARLTGAFWAVVALLLPVTAACVLLYGAVRGVTELDEVVLDERQWALRANAFRASYWTAVLVALGGGFILAGIENDLPLTAGMAGLVAALLFGLPAIYLAWHLPDELADDGEI